jgi:pyrimidine deaminase RibD-like protein
MPDADFWLIRKGSDKTVGTPVKEFEPSRIGVKIVRTDVLDPNYLYYAMMHLHNQGYFARLAVGTLKLVNIKVSDVANISFGGNNVTEAAPFPKSNDYIADELDKLQQYCDQNNMPQTSEYVKAYSMSFRESMKLGVQMFFWMRNENYRKAKWINKNLKTVGNKIDLTQFVKRELARKNSRISTEGWKNIVGAGAVALGALGSGGAHATDQSNSQQYLQLANKYYNVLVQRAKEDGRELDTRTLNGLKSRALDAATKTLEKNKSQPSAQPQQGFPSKGSEQKVAKDYNKFESRSMGKGKLNETQTLSTDEFKRWFAGSKVVDANGVPIVLYHGTNQNIAIFKLSKEGALGKGIYMTPDPAFASEYAMTSAFDVKHKTGNNVLPLYAKIVNPVKITYVYGRDMAGLALRALGVSPEKASDMVEKAYEVKGNLTNEIFSRAVKLGHDGILYYDEDGTIREAVAFSANQIKSVYNRSPSDSNNISTESQLSEFVDESVEDANPDTERRDKLKSLLRAGKDRGYIFQKEITTAFPEITTDDIASLSDQFEKMGIVVYTHEPDDNDSKPAPTQTKISGSISTSTPEFKKWFAGSKVVDTEGNPLRVYHAAPKGFEGSEFKPPKVMANNGGNNPSGYYFSPRLDDANMYVKHHENTSSEYETGAQIIPAYLSIKNPYIRGVSIMSAPMSRQYYKELIAANQHMSDEKLKYYADSKVKSAKGTQFPKSDYVGNNTDALKRIIQAGGFDGILDGAHWVAFYPNQIKSVFNQKPSDSNNISTEGLNESTGANTVTRIDSKPIKDFGTGLQTYYHTPDWSQSGQFPDGEKIPKKFSGKVTGLYAGDPHFTALYATGNANQTKYVAKYSPGQPIVYLDRKDIPRIRKHRSYLSVFDATNFKKMPSGEYFSENPGNPIEQKEITDPFQYMRDQGWEWKIVDDLTAVLKKLKKQKAKYGAEGMGFAESRINEASGYIPTAAEADDPRFEMALTVDVRPGALGKAANSFLLNTDSQGHPQELRPDGLVQRMTEELALFKKQTTKLTENKLKFSREKLDDLLLDLCDKVTKGQTDAPDFYGMVAAAVIDPTGRLATGINYLYGNVRIHAERDAIDRYEEGYGKLPKGSIVVTTLSPCNTGHYPNHPDRYGEDCQELLDSRGVKFVYCGYKNPEENPDSSIETDNPKIKKLCKQFADTFLKKHVKENVELDELKIDNVNGIGSVPWNQEIGYMGLNVLMKPSVFLKLALPIKSLSLNDKKTVDYLKKELDNRGIGAPFLQIDIPQEWKKGITGTPARIVGHDGRHRMLAIQSAEGDTPVEVHLLPRGFRNRDFKAHPEWIDELNALLISENGNYVTGPLFQNGVTETKGIGINVYEEDDTNEQLPSVNQAKNLLPMILPKVQTAYDDWDEIDVDTYAGGGICHILADAICDVLGNNGIECTPVSSSHEQHVYVAGKFAEGIYTIDIPYHIYETGGGFSWKKIPNITFETGDVTFYMASSDPADWKNYTDEY